eukprot:gnl/MRDRNA2_/MRDRNA2_94514_c0_seq1.p1 gnl/MRDRNA2_/MRDRNA2_94514_c0~~gnl/MRDRNA2_/MRDRNA2_94514_c0_seq1.p1  ORF type:complete len:228 (-),score=79.00 gnl/MRDRNA2_/MRDRNA2_94514_c0_seq1:131-814(-)
MAPITEITEISSQQVLAQAAQKLLDAVSENDAEPSPFATALLELMEHSSKLHEYEQMMAVAQQEASSDEAKTWQQVSLMTLQYCHKGLVEQQQRTLQRVTDLVEKGDTLFQASSPALPDAQDTADQDDAKLVPPSTPPPPPPTSAASGTMPAKPPGVWVTRPPPGLEAPPGLDAPPGLTKLVEVEKKPLAPWRKAEAEKKKKQQEMDKVKALGINFDAFSSGDEDSS